MLLLVSLLLPVSPSLRSTSFFDVLNGTDPTNPNNLHFNAAVGERLVVAHAELIDLDKDTNSTKDALVATIKAKDVKVFVLIGPGAFVDGITVYGLDRGIFGPGFQVLVSDGGVITEAMSGRSRLALVRLGEKEKRYQ